MLGKNKAVIILLAIITIALVAYFVIMKIQGGQGNSISEEDRIIKEMMKDAPKWEFPSRELCIKHGGKVPKKGSCEANWENATKICEESHRVLPSLAELKKIAISCGGIIDKNTNEEWSKNRTNKAYHACYREQGFISNLYWTSDTHVKYKTHAYMLYFSNAGEYLHRKKEVTSVRCRK